MERVVGQSGVVLGVQEKEFGCIGHYVPILVHPGDASRRIGLHQHKEHQEEPSVIDLLVAGICTQDLWLIWAANTGSETGGRYRGQLRQGGSTVSNRICCSEGARSTQLLLHSTNEMLPCYCCDRSMPCSGSSQAAALCTLPVPPARGASRAGAAGLTLHIEEDGCIGGVTGGWVSHGAVELAICAPGSDGESAAGCARC